MHGASMKHNCEYEEEEEIHQPFLDAVIDGVIEYDDFFDAYDFEGYKVYRSTNKIDWGEPITDVNGAIKFYKPLAQFDIDNEKSDFFPEQELGTNFYLGDNTGLKYTFVDENVTKFAI